MEACGAGTGSGCNPQDRGVMVRSFHGCRAMHTIITFPLFVQRTSEFTFASTISEISEIRLTSPHLINH
jgi:hypothetical protein